VPVTFSSNLSKVEKKSIFEKFILGFIFSVCLVYRSNNWDLGVFLLLFFEGTNEKI
jgi:hypothetical protein